MESNLIGRTILGYKVVSKLGAGAYGSVYKVIKENPIGTYTRVLKHIVLPDEKTYYDVLNQMSGNVEATNDYFEKCFDDIITEVQILNNFTENNVPNVVHYFENDVEIKENPRQYNLYILMEYLTPIQNYLASNKFTVNDVIVLGLDILYGLAASHNNGVIHRDVKLDNIFYSNNEFKIGDFGVSKVLDNSSRAVSLKGSPDYLAPEVYLGKEGYDKTVDLYSLGIVLYRLLNYNRNPFLPKYPQSYFPEDENEAFSKRITGEKPELPALGSPALGEVIVKAISPRGERYESAQEFYEALESVANTLSEDELNVVINEENIYISNDEYLNSINTYNDDIDNFETISSRNNGYPNNQETVSTSSNSTAETVKLGVERQGQTINPEPVNYISPSPSPVVVKTSWARRILPWVIVLLLLGIGVLLYLNLKGATDTSQPANTSTTATTNNSAQTTDTYIKADDSNSDSSSSSSSSSDNSSSSSSDAVIPPDKTYETEIIDYSSILNNSLSSKFIATASSQRYPINGFTYDPAFAIDRDLETAWVEGKEGDGAGESIQLTYTGNTEEVVNSAIFVVGYIKTSDIYYGNSIPTLVDMKVNGQHYCYIELQDTMEAQIAYFKDFTLKNGYTVTFTLDETQLGPDDPTYSVAITEVALR